MIITERWACKSKPEKFDYNGIAVPSERYAFLYDVKLGPLELGDSKERVDKAIWMASVEDNKVYLYKATGTVWGAPTLLVELSAGITDLALGFDALGQAVLFYAEGTVLKLWYFNSQLGQLTTQVITTNGKTPLIDFDRRANTSDPTSDVAIFYVENNSAYMRLQRDVYAIPYYTGVTQLGLRLLNSGMNTGNRFQVTYSYQDAQDGSNMMFKILESNRPVLENMKNNDFELKFTIAKPVTRCVLEKRLKDAYIGSDTSYTNDFTYDQYVHVIAEHNSTSDYTPGSDDGQLFSLAFRRDPSNAEGSYENVLLTLKGGGFDQFNSADKYYHTMTVPYTIFETAGDYILRFTKIVPNPATPWLDRRVEFIKNGAAIFDVIVTDTDSYVGVNPLHKKMVRNRLRFGGRLAYSTNTYAFYIGLYPAVYTDISVKINDRLVTWDKGYSDTDPVNSVPAGTTLKLYRQGDATIDFYDVDNLYEYLVSHTYEKSLANAIDIMDYLKEAVNP